LSVEYDSKTVLQILAWIKICFDALSVVTLSRPRYGAGAVVLVVQMPAIKAGNTLPLQNISCW